MLRQLHQCLIAVCLAGSLMLLMPFCCAGVIIEYEYDSTTTPDYDYNATFEISFYTNSSFDDLDQLIKENEINTEKERLDISQVDPRPTVSTFSNKASKRKTKIDKLTGGPETQQLRLRKRGTKRDTKVCFKTSKPLTAANNQFKTPTAEVMQTKDTIFTTNP